MFNKIKKQNGEAFAKAIRNYNNGIFDVENIDEIVKYAGRNAEAIIDYLVSLKNIQIEEHAVYQDPIQLLKKAGYNAEYADSLEKQNNIKPYFSEKEELCTFKDNERFKKYHIINCVKTDVDAIKREDFSNPKREDNYGTSVISIQILKTGGFISIKNRYNHTVDNCDNTFNSNPDNIIKGLSGALRYKYNVNFSSNKVDIPSGFIIIDNKIIKYNYEINNTYYGENFYITDRKIYEIDKTREIMIDNVILNMQTKKVTNFFIRNSSFIEALSKEIKDKKIHITRNKAGNKCLISDNKEILEIEKGKIISIKFDNITEIGDDFLYHNKNISSLSMQSLRKTGDWCFNSADSLINLHLPKLEIMGDHCFQNIKNMQSISLPKLEKMGNHCFYEVDGLEVINMPNLKKMKRDCFFGATKIKSISLPKLEKIGNHCFYDTKNIKSISLPKLKRMGIACFYLVNSLECVYLPDLEVMDKYCFDEVKKIKRVNLLNLESHIEYSTTLKESIEKQKLLSLRVKRIVDILGAKQR